MYTGIDKIRSTLDEWSGCLFHARALVDRLSKADFGAPSHLRWAELPATELEVTWTWHGDTVVKLVAYVAHTGLNGLGVTSYSHGQAQLHLIKEATLETELTDILRSAWIDPKARPSTWDPN